MLRLYENNDLVYYDVVLTMNLLRYIAKKVLKHFLTLQPPPQPQRKLCGLRDKPVVTRFDEETVKVRLL